MTYSITLDGVKHCKNNLCYERIKGISGLLEEVLPGVVVFHDVKKDDLQKAKKYLSSRFGHCSATIESEHYEGGTYCELRPVCTIKL